MARYCLSVYIYVYIFTYILSIGIIIIGIVDECLVHCWARRRTQSG